MADKITARFVIQIAGKPIENVSKVLEKIEESIKEDERFKLLDSEIIEPELDEETTMYSGLIELGIKFENSEKLMEFIVDYTPNSVEIEDPSTLKFDSVSFTAILNDMSSHLLKNSINLRQALIRIQILEKELRELQEKSNKEPTSKPENSKKKK